MACVLLLCFLLSSPAPQGATTLQQISKDHAVYIEAIQGDVLSITTDHRMGTDPDLIYVFGPQGKLQERLEITRSTTTQVTLDSGSGTYKILPVNYTYVHSYSIPGTRSMVVEPFAHEEFLRVTGSTDLYFEVPANTPSLTFFASSMWSAGTVREELYDPNGNLVHTFVLPQHTYQQSHLVTNPQAGVWRCRFITSGYDRCGAWLEGVPNYFAAKPADLFVPSFPASQAVLLADAGQVISDGARVGVNWWLNPAYPAFYSLERDAVLDAKMDTARISVNWAWRESVNDNADPFIINWQGFDFQGHDLRTAAYYDDIISAVPNAMPVLLLHWDDVGGNAVTWQLDNPASWSQSQREEYAEFVLATMIHTVAPDLQVPPSSSPAYDFRYVELLNEPNLAMGSTNYQAYIEIVKTVGQRLRSHPDSRINTLKIVASGIGGVWGEGSREMENWIGKLIDQADTYVDGVNWHQYEYIRLEENGRYAEDVEMVKGWLATRGDGVADEEILMTETNQHGGPPTCWRRQDTFYASLWWAGATFSALRGGAQFFHYYKLVDDPPGTYNWKGMMFHQGPYAPPVFPGGPAYGKKPILDAVEFVNTKRLEQVVMSTSDHAETAHLVTLSRDHKRVTVLIANLFDRTIRTDISVALPTDMHNRRYSVRVSWIDAGEQGIPGPKPAFRHRGSPTSSLKQTLELKPRSIYALEFKVLP